MKWKDIKETTTTLYVRKGEQNLVEKLSNVNLG